MMRGAPLYGLVAAAVLLPGCAMLNPDPLPPPVAPAGSVGGLVFAVDGAGGFEAFSRMFRDTVATDRIPLEVRCFRWTHGYCRVLADQVHVAHMQRQGRRLAELVLACHREAPDRPIYLAGHSAGCGVVLCAAEHLPPNTLERIILLAPAVSTNYDLRPALASACRGIEAFISDHDWACLGMGTLLAGTTDRCWAFGAAGKVGFTLHINDPQDAALYARLRQYPWNRQLVWTGHLGGHYGAYQPRFLRLFVLPLLVPRHHDIG